MANSNEHTMETVQGNGYTAARVQALDERLQRFEASVDEKLDAIMDKLEQRTEWEKSIEIRMAKSEVWIQAVSWVLGIGGSALIVGGLAFLWALLTNQLHVGP